MTKFHAVQELNGNKHFATFYSKNDRDRWIDSPNKSPDSLRRRCTLKEYSSLYPSKYVRGSSRVQAKSSYKGIFER
jgi:hypothetical protein